MINLRSRGSWAGELGSGLEERTISDVGEAGVGWDGGAAGEGVWLGKGCDCEWGVVGMGNSQRLAIEDDHRRVGPKGDSERKEAGKPAMGPSTAKALVQLSFDTPHSAPLVLGQQPPPGSKKVRPPN